MSLILRPPRPDDEAALTRMHAQLAAEGFMFFTAEDTWAEFLARTRRESAGVDLGPNRVRCDFLVGEVDGVAVGRVSIRYELTARLLAIGGHVGYAVAPEFRRRGYATEMLRQALSLLAAAGVQRVLLTCDVDNVGSRHVIEACGGIQEDVREAYGERKRRFWIDTDG